MFWFSLVCRPFASSSSLVLLLQSFSEIFPIYIVYVLYALIICIFASRAWHVYGVFRYFSQALRIKTMANCTRPTLTFWRAHPFLPAHYRNYTICHINIYRYIYSAWSYSAYLPNYKVQRGSRPELTFRWTFSMTVFWRSILAFSQIFRIIGYFFQCLVNAKCPWAAGKSDK